MVLEDDVQPMPSLEDKADDTDDKSSDSSSSSSSTSSSSTDSKKKRKKKGNKKSKRNRKHNKKDSKKNSKKNKGDKPVLVFVVPRCRIVQAQSPRNMYGGCAANLWEAVLPLNHWYTLSRPMCTIRCPFIGCDLVCACGMCVR